MACHDTIDSIHLDDGTLTSVLQALQVTIPALDDLSETAWRGARLGLLQRAVNDQLAHFITTAPAEDVAAAQAATDRPVDAYVGADVALATAAAHLRSRLPVDDTSVFTQFGTPTTADASVGLLDASAALRAVEAAQALLEQRRAPSHSAALRTADVADLAHRLATEAGELRSMHLDAALRAADVKDGVVAPDDVTFSWQLDDRTYSGTLEDYVQDWKMAQTGGLFITQSVLAWSGVRHPVQVEETGRGEQVTYRLSVLGVEVDTAVPGSV
ncbi:hypothetical protein [Streptomyces sp. MN6]